MNANVIAKRFAASISVVSALVFVLAGCSGPPADTGKSDQAADTAAKPAADAPGLAQQGLIAPPDGGGIIVGVTGIKQNSLALGNFQQSDAVWIPAGFGGSVSQIQITGLPQPVSLQSASIRFGSGAGLKVTAGAPAVWQCRASSTAAWATCATQQGSVLPSLFTIDASHSGAIVKPDGTNVPIAGNVQLSIQ